MSVNLNFSLIGFGLMDGRLQVQLLDDDPYQQNELPRPGELFLSFKFQCSNRLYKSQALQLNIIAANNGLETVSRRS